MSVLGNSNDVGQPPLSRRDFYRFGGGFNNLNARTGTSIIYHLILEVLVVYKIIEQNQLSLNY